MRRTVWLQKRRMEKFEDVSGHFQLKHLSLETAAELPGMSERTFRRYRRRWEEDGLEDLFDRRLDRGGFAARGAGVAGHPARRAPPPASAQALRRHDAAPESAPAKAGDDPRHEWLAGQQPLDPIVPWTMSARPS